MEETKNNAPTAIEQIKAALTQVRKSEANMHELAMLLEKEAGKHIDGVRLNRLALGNRAKDSVKLEELYQTFYSAYTIRLLEEYVDILRDRLLLFAVYGILPSYRNLILKERREKYAEDNPNVKFERTRTTVSGWSDPNSRLPDFEDKIINELAVQLDVETNSLRKKLGLSAAVFDELERKFPNGLPEELPSDFPKYVALNKSVSNNILDLSSIPEDGTTKEGQHSENDGISIGEICEQMLVVPILLNTQTKFKIIAHIRKVISIISILIVVGLCITISHNENSKQIEPEQIQHESVTYSEIQHEEVSTEDVPLDKPIFEKIAVYNDEEEKIKRIQLCAGESGVLVVHFSPDDAPKSKLRIDSEDTSILNVDIQDARRPGELPFFAKAEEKWNPENYITSITVNGQGAIPACVNVIIVQNTWKYDDNDMQNSGALKNGGLDNAE